MFIIYNAYYFRFIPYFLQNNASNLKPHKNRSQLYYYYLLIIIIIILKSKNKIQIPS